MPPLGDPQKKHFEVQVYGKFSGLGGNDQDTITDLYYFRTNNPAPYSATAFITAFHTAVKAAWLAAASEAWEWTKTTIRVLNDPTEAAIEVAVAETGGVTGDMLPGHVAAVIAKKTPLRGRFYAGRFYFPGVPKSASLGNELTSAHQTLLTTLKTALFGNITVAGNVFVPCVLSRVKSKMKMKDNPAVIEMNQITQSIIRVPLGSMRSRQSKVA